MKHSKRKMKSYGENSLVTLVKPSRLKNWRLINTAFSTELFWADVLSINQRGHIQYLPWRSRCLSHTVWSTGGTCWVRIYGSVRVCSSIPDWNKENKKLFIFAWRSWSSYINLKLRSWQKEVEQVSILWEFYVNYWYYNYLLTSRKDILPTKCYLTLSAFQKHFVAKETSVSTVKVTGCILRHIG